jgi:hypothetical protein
VHITYTIPQKQSNTGSIHDIRSEMGIYRADSAELAIADELIDYGYPKTAAAVFADLNYGSVTYGLLAVAL